MLNAHNLGISFQGEFLFEGVTFRLGNGDRIGLVGKNGAGKSTLLKIISGDMPVDEGTIAYEKEVQIGFLRQDIDFEQGRTVLQEAYTAFEMLQKIEFQLESVSNELNTRTDYESEAYHDLMIRLSDLTHDFEIHGGYQYAGDTEKVLLGLGFKRSDFDKQTDTFSGGWRMRIELAKLLLQKNDILLLDEPTNHLDIESILWLESFLKQFSGAVVLISHDKMFLDQVTNRTIELSLGKAYDFNKPYSQYLEIRGEIREKQLAAQKNQQKKIEETERLIEKFRAKASKASMAQSLIKKLDKVERIEVDEEDNAVMRIQFPVSVQPGRVVIEVKQLTKSFGTHTVFQNIDLLVERGKKIALVGQNGQGKSTFIKAIMKEFEYAGSIVLGHNVQLGYFAQNQAEYLDGNKTLLQIMEDAATDSNRMKIRDMLGSFLFRGDEVEKKVKVLSGGERNRLALCKMILQPMNVLLMDEPTNHLDIRSKNILKQALLDYEGTLIVVSHDRDFLQGLTDEVYEFKEGAIRQYLGDVNFFLEQKNAQTMREFEKAANISVKDTTKNTQKTKDHAADKSLRNKLKKIENDIQSIENQIKKSDAKLAATPELASDVAYFDAYRKLQTELDKLMEEWETLTMALEE